LIRRENIRVVGIKGHGLVEVFRGRRFRPLRISVTNSLFVSAFAAGGQNSPDKRQWKQSNANY
jgi:hypothetical protein